MMSMPFDSKTIKRAEPANAGWKIMPDRWGPAAVREWERGEADECEPHGIL
jgi:hypothetical protein